MDGIVLPVHFVTDSVTPPLLPPGPAPFTSQGHSAMAYRRRRTYRRKPVRRFRRRRFHRRRYRRSSGSLSCKLTKVSSFTVDQAKTNVWDGSFKMSDWPEHQSLKKNFELVKVKRVRITVVPMQNVSNNTTSICHSYCLTPWHYAITAPANFNNYMSSDKAKMFRGTQVGSQTYVPCITVQNKLQITGSEISSSAYDTTIWRPTLRTVSMASSSATEPLIWSGIIAWQGDPSTGAGKSHFNIRMDLWVTYKNQTNMHV